MSDCWLYRIWKGDQDGPEGELMYVGISDSPASRMGNHESQKWWWWLADTVTWQRYASREDAKKAETRAIQDEWPLFNIDESTWNNWERLEYIVSLAFRAVIIERSVAEEWFTCPFCVSRGFTGSVSFVDKPRIFVRRDDDQVVLELPVRCASHSEEITWAEQRKVESILGYARCQAKEVHELLSRAIQHADGSCFESRRTRTHMTLEEHLEMSVGVMAALRDKEMSALRHKEMQGVNLLTHLDSSSTN